MRPALDGAKAWVADVNARGGLNGHPVKVLFADDTSDPARALALTKRMVEQDKVVAFYAERMLLTAQAVMPYLEQKQIPIIGGCACNNSSANSSMYFNVGVYPGDGLVWAHVAPILAFSDKRKISILYCREAPPCPYIRDKIHELQASTGLKIVHEAQVSLAQPDFTGEMLAARNAGAEAVVIVSDGQSVVRAVRSAHRQGWQPLFSAQYSSHDERFLKAGGQDVEGLLLDGQLPHWTAPQLADYRNAMKKYVPNGSLSSIGTVAYTAGKLLEMMAVEYPAKPTTADILDGLYALHGETLGGLSPPITFEKGKPQGPVNECVVPLRVEKGAFVPWDGPKVSCPPGWTPVQR